MTSALKFIIFALLPYAFAIMAQADDSVVGEMRPLKGIGHGFVHQSGEMLHILWEERVSPHILEERVSPHIL